MTHLHTHVSDVENIYSLTGMKSPDSRLNHTRQMVNLIECQKSQLSDRELALRMHMWISTALRDSALQKFNIACRSNRYYCSIAQLGEWVMRTACRQGKEWQSTRIPPMRVGVNLSPVQFRRTDLVDTIERVLNDTGLEAKWLEIEITEGMIMDHAETVMDTLYSLRNLGVDLAIYDFGTGYSSLAYLQRFPVNRLKIDRSFVNDICSNPGNAAITHAIITLAHDLGMKVVAEGVVFKEQFNHLKSEACDEAQGFHITQPLTAIEMTKWLTESGGRFQPSSWSGGLLARP